MLTESIVVGADNLLRIIAMSGLLDASSGGERTGKHSMLGDERDVRSGKLGAAKSTPLETEAEIDE